MTTTTTTKLDYNAVLANEVPVNGLTLFTHDNGARPFMVDIKPKEIRIYTREKFPTFKEYCKKMGIKSCKTFVVKSKTVMKTKTPTIKIVTTSNSGIKKTITKKFVKIEEATPEYKKYLTAQKDYYQIPPSYSNLLHIIKDYEEVFVGTDCGKEQHHGGSVLVKNHKDKLSYTEISDSVTVFDAPEPILMYTTNTGNNDVHYPFAITKKFILFLSDFYYSKLAFHPNPFEEDPYQRFYGHVAPWIPEDEKQERVKPMHANEIIARDTSR